MSSRFWGSLLCFAVTAMLFSLSLANRPFYSRGEAREALVVSAMAREHNFVLPSRSGTDVPSKPPMFHWLAVAATQVTGHFDEFAIRLPSALAAAGTIAVTFFLVTEVAPLGMSLAAVLFLSSAFEFSRSATHARVDMCFLFFLTIVFSGLYYLLPRIRVAPRSPHLATLALAIGIGGAVLTKGPVGIVFPALVAGLYVLCVEVIDGSRSTSFPSRVWTALYCERTWRIALAFVAGAVVATGWYYAAYLQGGSKFLYTQLFKENIGRMVEVDGESPGHVKPFYFSLVDLLTGFLPWSVLFPVVGGCMLQRLRRDTAWVEQFDPGFRRLWFLSITWALVLLGVVSLSLSKRPVYLLPAFPALAFMTAAACKLCSERISVARTIRGFSYLIATVVSVLLCATLIAQSPELSEALASNAVRHHRTREDVITILHAIGVGGIFAKSAILLLVAAFLALSIVVWRNRRAVRPETELAWCASVVVAVTAAVNGFVLPPIAARTDAREFIAQVAQAVPPDRQIYSWKDSFYAAAYYTEQIGSRTVQSVKDIREVDRSNDSFMLVAERELHDVELEIQHGTVILQSSVRAANGEGQLALVQIPPAE